MNARKGLRRRLPWVIGLLAALGLTIGTAIPASAETGPDSGTQDQWEVIHWTTPRWNFYSPSRTEMSVINSGWGGGSLVIGLRDPSGIQFARAESWAGSGWVPLLDGSSPLLPSGVFYLNSRFNGHMCGGSGCGLMLWEINLHWNY